MGCAIGMSLVAAVEIFYWVFIKPIIKFRLNNNPSPTQRRFLRLLHRFVFLAIIVYAVYRFFLVHQLKYSILEKWNYIYQY